jgi:hypothetical protein
LLNDSINTVFIATPHSSHADLVVKALERGKNVFVEKPLAINRDQLDEVIDARIRYPKPLMVGFNRRFAPVTEMLKAQFKDISEPLVINIRVNAGLIPKDHWIQNPEIGGGKIAVAHNLNDQAETILQRIIRGTGIDGLAAMSYINKDIIRPMLNVKKNEVIKYLSENNYEFCIDRTNLEDIYGRNKIRLNLIPYLEKDFNPNIQNTLFRMSEAMENDSKIIERYTDVKYREVLLEKNENEIHLDITKLKALENFETSRIIRKAIEEFKGDSVNIEMKHIEYANEFISSGKTGKKINLTDGIVIEISYNDYIVRKKVDKTPDFKYNVNIGEPLYIKETGHAVRTCIIDLT